MSEPKFKNSYNAFCRISEMLKESPWLIPLSFSFCCTNQVYEDESLFEALYKPWFERRVKDFTSSTIATTEKYNEQSDVWTIILHGVGKRPKEWSE